MPQTKIVFFDIDGTLIDMQAKKITPKMLETLHRLQDRGIKICIATGRSPMVLPKIDGVAFDAYLTFNGSLCYDRKGVIFSNPIPHKDVVRFIQNAAALGRPICVSTRDRLAANGTDTDLTDYFFIANEPVPVADDFDAVCAEDIYQLMLGCRPKDYWRLLRDPGYSVDFSQKYGNAAFLMNVGVYGLFIVLYYNLVGATFNAVTFGCIFCMLACCCSGSHPGNVWPIMVGYVAASFLGKWFCVGEAYTQAINAQAIVVGLCFANGLSPISGRYGWPFGILAGMLHFTLVTSVPLLHGGFCLYNGGFTAAFVCMFFIPVFERFFRTKEERRLAKAERTANSQ